MARSRTRSPQASPGPTSTRAAPTSSKQIEMGLYGALIVRPTIGANFAYDSTTQFDPAREYMLLLAEIDPDLHHAVETGGTYDFNAAPQPLLHDQRPRVPGHHPGQRLRALPEPAVRRAGAAPAVRRQHQPPAGADPDAQRGRRSTTRSTRTATTTSRSPRTDGCCSARAGAAPRPSTSARRSAPARPRTS